MSKHPATCDYTRIGWLKWRCELHETCYDWLRSIFGLVRPCTEFLPYRLPALPASTQSSKLLLEHVLCLHRSQWFIQYILSTFTIKLVWILFLVKHCLQVWCLGECSCYDNKISVNHFVWCFLIVVASKCKHSYRHHIGRLKQVASLPKYLHWQ